MAWVVWDTARTYAHNNNLVGTMWEGGLLSLPSLFVTDWPLGDRGDTGSSDGLGSSSGEDATGRSGRRALAAQYRLKRAAKVDRATG